MNNDAFRALINKQRQSSAAEKSTKEIAREAVENEFQNKRRHGGGRRGARGYDDGYGSDSGGSSDEDARGRLAGKDGDKKQREDENVPEWKRRRREKKNQAGDDYRDRAKERREGNNADYASLQGLSQSGEVDRKRQAELSKYLGGDEEHTHLVKGLDKALAEKVRREEMGQGDIGNTDTGKSKESGDLDQLLESAYAKRQGESRSRETQDWQTTTPKSELGKSVLSYLLQKKRSESSTTLSAMQINVNSALQKSIRRSMLTFSLDSDVRNRKNAWEAPETSVRAFGTHTDITFKKMTPFNHQMIATISKKLDEGTSRGKEKRKYHIHANGEGKNGIKSDESPSLRCTDNGHHRETNSNNDAKGKIKANNKPMDKEDSDDDIFENVGTYIPDALAPKSSEPEAVVESTDPTTKNNGEHGTSTEDNEKINQSPTQDTHKQTKQSIFDNLITESATEAPPHRTLNLPKQQQSRLQINHKKPSQQKRNVIDRDIFGGQQNDSSLEYSKRRGPTSAAMEGVSMTSYQGGYGEEMDVDFGGNDEERRRKDKGDANEKEGSGGEGSGDDEEA